jgi:uncharacterized membrane protein
MWIILALISAICAAARRTNQKKIATKINHFTYGFAVQLLGLPFIIVALLLYGKILNPMHLKASFWIPLVIVSFAFYPLNAYLAMQAIKEDELSKVLPLQSLWPVFSLLPAWLMLGQVPTILATLGVIITVLGVYVLGLNGKSLHHPLEPFRQSRGSRYMLYGVIQVTAAGVLDKIAINASNAIYYSFFSTVGAVISIGILLRLKRINQFDILRQNLREIGIMGSLQGASYTTYLMAIAAGPLAYVTAVRGSNILMGAILGILILKERITYPKIASFILIALGSIMLAVGT